MTRYETNTDIVCAEQGCTEIEPDNDMLLSKLRWTALIPICLCIVLLGWFYYPTFKWWYGMWMMDESYYSHGILVPMISGFIIWLKKNRLREMALEPSVTGFALLIPAILVSILATWGNASSICGMTFPIAVAGLSLAFLGKRITRELAFPIGYLFFMCVMPTLILTMVSFRIQMLSTIGGTTLLKMLGIDAYREGAIITLRNVEVLVGAPCSGFRLLISLFAFSALFAYLKEGPWWGKGLIVAMTLPLSLILNSLRIAMIAIVGEFMGTQAMHSFHDFSGYIVLILAFVMLYLFAKVVKCQKFNSTLIS